MLVKLIDFPLYNSFPIKNFEFPIQIFKFPIKLDGFPIKLFCLPIKFQRFPIKSLPHLLYIANSARPIYQNLIVY